MAKGAASKQNVMATILETFPGSFLWNDNKEIRIPCQEDGAEVQIKVTLTCAKDNVSAGTENVLPGAAVQVNATPVQTNVATPVPAVTEEEKKNIADLMSKLGL